MSTKPPTLKLFRAVAGDVLRTARAKDYPIITDRGAPTEVVMATLAVLIRAAGERTDAGIKVLLQNCCETVLKAFHSGDLTEREGMAAMEVLGLARPWRHDWVDGPPIPLQEMYGRAEAWASSYSWVDALAVQSVGVQLLQMIEHFHPATLAKLAHEVENLTSESEEQ